MERRRRRQGRTADARARHRGGAGAVGVESVRTGPGARWRPTARPPRPAIAAERRASAWACLPLSELVIRVRKRSVGSGRPKSVINVRTWDKLDYLRESPPQKTPKVPAWASLSVQYVV